MMSIVGKSTTRLDALKKVTGKALYPGDINLPNQTYMKILFSNRPHAVVQKIDTSRAEALPGVVAVFTAKDVPVNEYGLIMNDQPVLCGPGSNKAGAERVRFIGDQIALIIAESEEIAAQGRDLIEVEYVDLPPVTDPEKAMQPGAVIIHPEKEQIEGTPNLFTRYRIRKGDIDAGFEKSDVIIDGEYRTPVQEHAFLQPEAGIGFIDEEGRVTIKVAGQWVHEDQQQIAHALDLPIEKVRVIYAEIGGAFGGREDMSIQIVLALAVFRLHQSGINRPVKIIWSREESIIGHHKRHSFLIRTRWGANKNGKLTAVEAEIIQDGGAYCYTSNKVMGNATLMSTGPYEVPNVKVDSYCVYTNNIPGGAFRGFGGPQAAFAAETQMNKLAEKLGIDVIELRMRNLLTEGALMSVQTPLPKGISLAKVVQHCAEYAGWLNTEKGWSQPEITNKFDWLINKKDEALPPYIKRGIGFACGFKNIGFSFGAPENCWATIELHGNSELERAVIRHGAADVGQGAHTAIVQMVADAVNLPLERVEAIFSDTAYTENSGSVSASRMTFMAGNAVRGAVELALEKWRNEERPAISTYQYITPKTTPYDPENGRSFPNFAYGYMAQIAAVEVDMGTGQVSILNLISADDVGKAVNPQQVEGQIEGGVVQAMGYVLMEDFIQNEGYVFTPNFSTYLIPGILDIPGKVIPIILEYPDPLGPWGVRGMAEMPFIPVAPAVIAAVHDATGVWFDQFPLTPPRVLKGLSSKTSD